MDANSKFGNQIIKNDPNEKMSENGKRLYEIINNEELILVNGTITRFRKTVKSTEMAVIDFFIICKRLYVMLLKMTIDEDRQYVLTKFSSKKGQKKLVESDHNLMWCNFVLQWMSFIKKD